MCGVVGADRVQYCPEMRALMDSVHTGGTCHRYIELAKYTIDAQQAWQPDQLARAELREQHSAPPHLLTHLNEGNRCAVNRMQRDNAHGRNHNRQGRYQCCQQPACHACEHAVLHCDFTPLVRTLTHHRQHGRVCAALGTLGYPRVPRYLPCLGAGR